MWQALYASFTANPATADETYGKDPTLRTTLKNELTEAHSNTSNPNIKASITLFLTDLDSLSELSTSKWRQTLWSMLSAPGGHNSKILEALCHDEGTARQHLSYAFRMKKLGHYRTSMKYFANAACKDPQYEAIARAYLNTFENHKDKDYQKKAQEALTRIATKTTTNEKGFGTL